MSINPMTLLKKIKKDLRKVSSKRKAKVLQRFFKTGKGQYGHGDVFIGVTVPDARKIAIKYLDLGINDLEVLLSSKIHEERLCALLILVHNFKKGSIDDKKRIFDFYLKNTNCVNNWDLVDLSADKIVGAYLLGKDRSALHDLVNSNNLWERRISVISTFYFIKNNDFDDTLKIASLLLKDKHDLIHKAVGWMLREVGKRDQKVEEDFLKKHYKEMPRTMLRYAIEKFEKNKRLEYLQI